MSTVRNIDRGGFGIVDEIVLPDGTHVARKTLDPLMPLTSSEMEKLEARFKREVGVQSSLKSECFVPILNYDLDDSKPWFTMPLAEKNFLKEIEECRSKSQVPQSALADILNALEELHQLGFVHRDLKPQNILFTNGKWKLTDFGLVRINKSTTTMLTSTGSNWGTEEYCAPEQAIAFRSVNYLVDIYAFGCILHDIFVGTPRVPYSRQTGPGAIGTIIEKCTEVKPEKRFKTIQALRGSLLTQLSNTIIVAPGTEASDWIDELSNLDSWDSVKLHQFCRYLIETSNKDDLFAVMTIIDEDTIQKLLSIDFELWKTMVMTFCEWIEKTSFSFDYCDVLVPRLIKIFDLGDYESKSKAVLAAAELASSHNRWYVMRSVVRMCSSSIEQNLAQRIAIEITAMDVKRNFKTCVNNTNQTIEAYHPLIMNVLK